ncbi:MAG: hypothetical protein R6U89_05315 [Dehalococcoidia bacterium]
MELLTVREAAGKAGVTPDHMRRLLNNRKVYGIKFGQEWIVAVEEIERFRRSSRGRPRKKL